MPRVSITKEQKEAAKMHDVCKCILDSLKQRQGLLRYSEEEFSSMIGVSEVTWWRWVKKDGIAKSEFRTVMLAALRAGVSLQVTAPSPRSVSFGDCDAM